MSETKEMKSSNLKSKKPRFNWQTATVIVVLILALSGWYYWSNIRTTDGDSSEVTTSNSVEESDQVIASLDQILIPTTDARPTVARIEDPDVLRSTWPEFYKDAESGDYLVLYPNRAVIYRESENLIVNVAPIVNPSSVTPPADEQ